MNRNIAVLIRISTVSALASFALLWSGDLRLDGQSSLVSSAEARVGRPLTPVSYAGVARRTTARAVAVGAAAAPVYVAPPAYPPACYQAVDPYGRVYTRCP